MFAHTLDSGVSELREGWRLTYFAGLLPCKRADWLLMVLRASSGANSNATTFPSRRYCTPTEGPPARPDPLGEGTSANQIGTDVVWPKHGGPHRPRPAAPACPPG
jgi:hypothetical protein